MYFISTFLSVLVLVLLLVPGFILRKIKLLSEKSVKDLSNILLYIGTPALMVNCMLSVNVMLIPVYKIILCLVASIIIIVLGYVVAKLVFIKDKDNAKKASCCFASVFSNCGFMGIPIAVVAINYSQVFNETAQASVSEAMLYVTLFNVVFNILNWMLGSTLFNGEKNMTFMLKKAFINPCTIAVIAALPLTIIFSVNNFSLINDPIVIGELQITQIGTIITYLSNICVPVSMIILGARLADMRIMQVFKSTRAYIVAVIRLLVIPIASLGLLLLLSFWWQVGAAFVVAMVVMAATPSASTALAFAERFNGDSATAGECVVVTTILSAVTVPLFLMITSAIV